jgi:hypothetical protein
MWGTDFVYLRDRILGRLWSQAVIHIAEKASFRGFVFWSSMVFPIGKIIILAISTSHCGYQAISEVWTLQSSGGGVFLFSAS